MSQARKVSDIERTTTMLDLLHRKYWDERLSHVVVEEVAQGTGARARRWADVLVLGIWPSGGMQLDGFEVKASKADLKRELADLKKHQAVARYCDHWTLVTWDDSILVDGIPEDWGIVVTVDGEYGRELKTIRHAPKREPEPWPRSFVCSLVRNAHRQSPGGAFVGRACAEASARGFREGKHTAESVLDRAIDPLRRALYGRDSWQWPAEARDDEAVLKLAAQRLAQGVLSVGGAA